MQPWLKNKVQQNIVIIIIVDAVHGVLVVSYEHKVISHVVTVNFLFVVYDRQYNHIQPSLTLFDIYYMGGIHWVKLYTVTV